MNEDQRHDEVVLGQIDRLLEHNIPHDEALINRLAAMRPNVDRTFQEELGQRLMARLQTQLTVTVQEKDSMRMTGTHRPRFVSIAPLTWAATLATVAVALVSMILVNLNHTATPLTTETQIDQPVSLVIATGDIPAGTEISETMIATITLSAAVAEALRKGQPEGGFVTDAQTVIGQTAAVDIAWFQPIETTLLGEYDPPCNRRNARCSVVPEGYYTIGLPRQPDTLQGLKIGDRVDVLAWADDQIRVMTANVLLVDVQDELVTLATPSWQLGVLMWLSHSGDSYALRLHTGGEPDESDNTPVEYVLTSPEALPQDFLFDLIVNVPASQGYLLTNLPAPIDDVAFTSNGDTLYFRFNNLELVGIADGTTVTIRMPEDDAANLDYLIGLRMELAFVPDEATYR